MFASLTRNVKRFLILVPGLIIGYFAYTDIFPALDHWLPDSLALIATYLLAAYVLIPKGLRLFRWVFRPSHLPLYSTTPDGFASDPLNVGVIGTKQQLTHTMTKAGWHTADRHNLRNIMHMVVCIIFRRPYHNAPFSSLYLFGRKQDIGFQLPVSDEPSHRHHVRFWAVGHTEDARHLEHVSFWQRIHRSNPGDERVLWVGAASMDIGLGIIRHTTQLTHMIHPDTNAERDLIVDNLKATGLVKKVRTQQVGKPYRLSNRVITGYLYADGHLKITEL